MPFGSTSTGSVAPFVCNASTYATASVNGFVVVVEILLSMSNQTKEKRRCPIILPFLLFESILFRGEFTFV